MSKKILQLFVGLVAVLAITVSTVSAQEYGQKYTRTVLHLTDKTTHNIATQTVTLYTLIINVSGAGSSWTITVQDATAVTPRILYSATAAVGTTVIPLPVGVTCANGLSIVGAGTTAGTADVWITYR